MTDKATLWAEITRLHRLLFEAKKAGDRLAIANLESQIDKLARQMHVSA